MDKIVEFLSSHIELCGCALILLCAAIVIFGVIKDSLKIKKADGGIIYEKHIVSASEEVHFMLYVRKDLTLHKISVGRREYNSYNVGDTFHYRRRRKNDEV